MCVMTLCVRGTRGFSVRLRVLIHIHEEEVMTSPGAVGAHVPAIVCEAMCECVCQCVMSTDVEQDQCNHP